MKPVNICCHSPLGYEGDLVSLIEVDINPRGLFALSISVIGLPDKAIIETRERVRTAIKNNGFSFPTSKVLVNFSPAGIKKLGTSFDLAIVLTIWQKSESPDLDLQEPILVLGELHLDGSISPVKGVLPVIILAKKRGVNFCIIPNENLYEVDIIQNITIWGITHLLEAIEHVKRLLRGFPIPTNQTSLTDYNFYSDNNQFSYDFSHIKGLHRLKRASEIVAEGGDIMF